MDSDKNQAVQTPQKHRLSDALEKNKWVKGQSGNPHGRPAGTVSIVESLKRKLSEIEPESKRTYLDLFMETYLRKTIKGGDSKLIVDYINRVDGMPKQKIEQDGTLEVKWSNDNNNTLHATTTPEATPRIED
jgi:hypothetical protein